MSISTSSTAERFGYAYWRQVPHVFVPSGWGGRAYCDLCADPRRRVIHLKDLPWEDPRRHAAVMGRGYPTGRRTDRTWYRIEGWNDGEGGSSCSYPGGTDFDAACDAARIMRVSGDTEGRHYDHYLVAEIYEHTVCDTNYPEIPEEER